MCIYITYIYTYSIYIYIYIEREREINKSPPKGRAEMLAGDSLRPPRFSMATSRDCQTEQQAGIRNRTEPAEANPTESLNFGTGRNRTRGTEPNRTEPNRTEPNRATTRPKNAGRTVSNRERYFPELNLTEPMNCPEPNRIEPNRFLPGNTYLGSAKSAAKKNAADSNELEEPFRVSKETMMFLEERRRGPSHDCCKLVSFLSVEIWEFDPKPLLDPNGRISPGQRALE